MNLDNIGVSTIKDSTAFKKIQFFSKSNPTNLFNVKSDFQNSFKKLNNYYLTDLALNESYTYGMDRQHTHTSLSSTLPNFSTLLDQNSINKFFNYNFNFSKNNTPNTLELNRFNYPKNNNSTSNSEFLLGNIHKLLPSKLNNINYTDFYTFLAVPNNTSVLGAENDSKQYSNSFKFLLNFKHKKKSLTNYNYILNTLPNNDTFTKSVDPTNNFNSHLYNTENTLKFKDYKSSNAQFLGSERTVRLLTNVNSNTFKWNTSYSPNLPTTLENNLLDYGKSQNYVYSTSLSNWSDFNKYLRFGNNNI
jgi:hypothetical protein